MENCSANNVTLTVLQRIPIHGSRHSTCWTFGGPGQGSRGMWQTIVVLATHVNWWVSQMPSPTGCRLFPVPVFEAPLDWVMINVVDTLSKTESGNMFVFTLVNLATRYCYKPQSNLAAPSNYQYNDYHHLLTSIIIRILQCPSPPVF